MNTSACEKRLRRTILRLLEAGTAIGAMRGQDLVDALEFDRDLERTVALTGTPDGVVLRLCRDLVNAGLATAQDQRRLKHEKPNAENTAFAVTAKGTALLAGLIPVVPLVEDERIG